MSKTQDFLITEHNAIIDIDKEDECYTSGRPRIDYIEGFYVGDFNPITANLRFYLRKKGPRKGRLVALYVNPKTGKSMKNPVEAYMKMVDEKLASHLAPIKHIDVNIFNHARVHIKVKIIKNQRQTITRLRKEKEKARQ